jgi:hypothetical protein
MPQDQAVRELVPAGRNMADFELQMSVAFASIGIELQSTQRGRARFKP